MEEERRWEGGGGERRGGSWMKEVEQTRVVEVAGIEREGRGKWRR